MKLKFFTLSLIAAGLFSTSCLKEDHSDCYNIYKLALSYYGDGGTEIFSQKIDRVEMYVFDESAVCVSSGLLSDADVASRSTVLPPLEPGDYRIVCVGNTYETGMENLSSGDYSKMLFAAEDYIEGRTVKGNDSLYYASHNLTVLPFDPTVYERKETISFASSHYDIYVEVVNAPDYVGNHPEIEIVGVSPQTDFENVAKGQAADYVMETVHDGSNTTTAVSNIMRHKNHGEVWLRVTGEDGNQVAMISFADHIEANKEYIDTSKHECLIPFRIEFGTPEYPIEDGECLEISITVPKWVVENVTPEF